MRLTFTNDKLRTAAAAYVGADGVLSPGQVRRLRAALAPAGFPGAGPLGEHGPQRPPEAPGFEYQVEALDRGGARVVAHQIRETAAALEATA